MNGTSATALRLYADNADSLAARYEAVDPAAVFAPLADLLPAPGRMLDIGAGTGRQSRWFASQGFAVTAVEPTEGFRRVGEASAVEAGAAPIGWLADSLPDLTGLGARRFDFILLSGVWHHLSPEERRLAFARLAELLGPEGRILISLRHGPGMTGVDATDGAEESVRAHDAGLRTLALRDTESVQDGNRASGVTWTWLALRAGERRNDQ